MKDQLLWKDMLGGDKKSLEIIYREYVNILFDYGRRFSEDQSLIEDCIQNLFLNIWDRRSTLGNTQHIKSYLMLALRRRLVFALQQQRKTVLKENDLSFFVEVQIDKESEMIRDEDLSILHSKLKKVIDELSERQKELLYLKFEQNLNNQEIADLLQMENQSVRNAVHRLILKMKNKLIVLFF